MQKRLLSEADLTLVNAMKLALGMEAADRNTRSFKGTETAIKKLHSRQNRVRGKTQACYRCGKSGHVAPECRFKDAECHACGKKGHIAPVCRSKPQPKSHSPINKHQKKPQGTHLVQREKEDSTDSDTEEDFRLFKFKEPASAPIQIPVKVEDKSMTMELDTGAAVSIISETTRKEMFPSLKLYMVKITLKTYTDETMQVMGQLNVHVQYGSQSAPLVLIVVAGDGPSLFGRNWLKFFRLDCNRITMIRAKSSSLDALLQKHDCLFKEELGIVRPQKATLHVKPDATPKFFKTRPVPFANETTRCHNEN